MRRHVSDLAWRPIIKGGDIDEIVVAMGGNEEAGIDSVGGPRCEPIQLAKKSGVSRSQIQSICLQALRFGLLPTKQHLQHVEGEHPQVLPGIPRGFSQSGGHQSETQSQMDVAPWWLISGWMGWITGWVTYRAPFGAKNQYNVCLI